jgi:hypothetical protein
MVLYAMMSAVSFPLQNNPAIDHVRCAIGVVLLALTRAGQRRRGAAVCALNPSRVIGRAG